LDPKLSSDLDMEYILLTTSPSQFLILNWHQFALSHWFYLTKIWSATMSTFWTRVCIQNKLSDTLFFNPATVANSTLNMQPEGQTNHDTW
jgi:hypothetical protein